jgi:hypothetical protein
MRRMAVLMTESGRKVGVEVVGLLSNFLSTIVEEYTKQHISKLGYSWLSGISWW